jgi:hypothetical protein
MAADCQDVGSTNADIAGLGVECLRLEGSRLELTNAKVDRSCFCISGWSFAHSFHMVITTLAVSHRLTFSCPCANAWSARDFPH